MDHRMSLFSSLYRRRCDSVVNSEDRRTIGFVLTEVLAGCPANGYGPGGRSAADLFLLTAPFMEPRILHLAGHPPARIPTFRVCDITGQSLPVFVGVRRVHASTTIRYWSFATRLTCQDLTGSGSPPEEKLPTGSENISWATTF